VLDVGTGSGCIAVSLAKLRPGLKVTATDISPESLACCARNARRHGVAVESVQSDLFSALGERKFDMIVSNPPYVRSGDIDGLEPEVRSEPRQALDGGRDGLDFYRRIAQSAAGFLKKGGLLILETGYDQAGPVRGLLEGSRDFVVWETIKDYAGIERVVVASAKI
jgi:release factor glutamine methyltransferase